MPYTGPVSTTTQPSPPTEDCPSCRARARYRQIEQLWNEGRSFPEIMAELDVSQGFLAGTVNRMRRNGYNLPYRRRRP